MTHCDEEIEIDTGLTLAVKFGYRPGVPAQTYGPAENCYPGEAPEFEITKLAWLDDVRARTPCALEGAPLAFAYRWLEENFETE